jgi:hypothetical protein
MSHSSGRLRETNPQLVVATAFPAYLQAMCAQSQTTRLPDKKTTGQLSSTNFRKAGTRLRLAQRLKPHPLAKWSEGHVVDCY